MSIFYALLKEKCECFTFFESGNKILSLNYIYELISGEFCF